MSLYKRAANWLCRKYPGLTGAYSYYGIRVYFPKNSFSSRVMREQGSFESDNVRLLQALVKPGTWLFDVGANVGFMAVPVLAKLENIKVLSFEPSPNVLPYLKRTVAESPFNGRWTLVPKAIGAEEKKVTFNLSARENSEFDGMKHTNRVPTVGKVEVEMGTVDSEWMKLGKPNLSVLKCDVEGAEMEVLRGARACLAATRPFVLLEWNRHNFEAYGVAAEELLTFATANHYQVLTVPNFIEIKSKRELELHMITIENFLLAPIGNPGNGSGPKLV